jgi:hypothetical protein
VSDNPNEATVEVKTTFGKTVTVSPQEALDLSRQGVVEKPAESTVRKAVANVVNPPKEN